jgi:long-subunit acyl-CoA synthetase (AMP-forming)
VTLTDDVMEAEESAAEKLKKSGRTVTRLSDVEAAGASSPTSPTPAAYANKEHFGPSRATSARSTPQSLRPPRSIASHHRLTASAFAKPPRAPGARDGLALSSRAVCSASTPALLMYTSGTTGNPKGVKVSHSNIIAAAAGASHSKSALGPFVGGSDGERFLAYLPLAHIMEFVVEFCACATRTARHAADCSAPSDVSRTVPSAACFCQGVTIGYGGVGTILPTAPKMAQTTPPQMGDAQAFGPTVFLAAPAVLDRLYAVVNGKINAAPGPIKAWFQAALKSGAERHAQGMVGANPLLGIIFKPVQKLLGGRVKIIGTGSAPLGIEIARFCATAFACPVVQGYGLTETSVPRAAPLTMARATHRRAEWCSR